MVLAFFCLLMFCGVVGVIAWLSLRKIAAHLRKHPTAAAVVAEYILAVLLKRGDGNEDISKQEQPESPPEEPPDIGLETNGKTILTPRPK